MLLPIVLGPGKCDRVYRGPCGRSNSASNVPEIIRGILVGHQKYGYSRIVFDGVDTIGGAWIMFLRVF